ncbi:MAG TPA: hypothetical protein PK339_12420 [Flavitalea sp.]|nr:hypothetical protein [Flavitalea sp.]
MACEKNILEVPLSPTSPAPTDLLMFTLPDGSSFLRDWAHVKQDSTPDDIETEVAESDGMINNGDGTVIITEHIGWRVRVFRNSVPMTTINTRESYYSFDINTGEYTFVPAATTRELFQFQAY